MDTGLHSGEVGGDAQRQRSAEAGGGKHYDQVFGDGRQRDHRTDEPAGVMASFRFGSFSAHYLVETGGDWWTGENSRGRENDEQAARVVLRAAVGEGDSGQELDLQVTVRV